MTDADMARRWIASDGKVYETEAAYLAAFAAVVRADEREACVILAMREIVNGDDCRAVVAAIQERGER